MLHSKKPFYASFLFCFLIYISAVSASAEENWRIIWQDAPTELEGITFTDIHHNTVELTQFKGKPVILNLWATWCPPCVKELPEMQALSIKHANVFSLIALSGDVKGFQTITPFVQKHGLGDLTMYYDKNMRVFMALQAKGLPTSYLINATGQLIGRIEGAPEWNDDFLKNILDKMQ